MEPSLGCAKAKFTEAKETSVAIARQIFRFTRSLWGSVVDGEGGVSFFHRSSTVAAVSRKASRRCKSQRGMINFFDQLSFSRQLRLATEVLSFVDASFSRIGPVTEEHQLLEFIEEGIVTHGDDLGGWTQLFDGQLKLFDGRITLNSEIYEGEDGRREMAH